VQELLKFLFNAQRVRRRIALLA